MDSSIFCGADVHDKTILGRFAFGTEEPTQRVWMNNKTGRKEMINELRKKQKETGATKVIFAYEASGLGFGLHDELEAKGIKCHLLAPTKMRRSPKDKKNKNDGKDAQRILEELRNHYLAGSPLPSVWIPDQETRDDRELVRRRLEIAGKITEVKNQIQSLLKRNQISKHGDVGKNWTKSHRKWLSGLPDGADGMGSGTHHTLASLLRQLEFLEEEVGRLNVHLKELSLEDRYRKPAKALQEIKGVGLLAAMVFLTEMGKLSRFPNRRTVGAYFGLVPACHESGEVSDRKGHITRQGSNRVRGILCQSAWVRVRWDPGEKAAFGRIASKNPKRKKIALVASMRRLAILMWHVAMSA